MSLYGNPSPSPVPCADIRPARPVLYLVAIAVYVYRVVPSTCLLPLPSSRALVHPSDRPPSDLTANFATLPLPFSSLARAGGLPEFPRTLLQPTLELASSHLVCSVVLTGVLVLQAGRWWAEQADIDDDDADEVDDKGAGTETGAETGTETDRAESEPLRRRETGKTKA